MPTLSIEDAVGFLQKSKQNGWAVYAGVTPPKVQSKTSRSHKPSHLTRAGGSDGLDATSTSEQTTELRQAKVTSEDLHGSSLLFATAQNPTEEVNGHSPLSIQPSILVFGGEEFGLRRSLKTQADYFVSMKAAKRSIDIGLDSLNVSVAAGLITREFLRRPSELPEKDNGDLGFGELWS